MMTNYAVYYTQIYLRYSAKQNLMCEDQDDVVYIARKILNSFNGKRLISKQETCFHLSRHLTLTICSDIIQDVSISGYFRLFRDSTKGSCTNFIYDYARRDEDYEHMSLNDYFHHVKNQNSSDDSKLIIPNFTGMNGKAVYPVTAEYAKATLITHKPWSIRNKICLQSNNDTITMFLSWINSAQSPKRAKIRFAREKIRFNLDIQKSELKHIPATKDNKDNEDELVQHFSRMSQSITNKHNLGGWDVDVGIHHDWSSVSYDVSIIFSTHVIRATY